MIFTELAIPGVYLVELEQRTDERGFFARTFCTAEFEAHGLAPSMPQANISYNHVAGTLRGMHMQIAPHEEAKLIRCVRGAIRDVIVDMRPESATFLRNVGVDLHQDGRTALYVPEGFAHGYQTLMDSTEVHYPVSEAHAPGFERGYRYDDPSFGIEWPVPVTCISEKDAGWPLRDSQMEG